MKPLVKKNASMSATTAQCSMQRREDVNVINILNRDMLMATDSVNVQLVLLLILSWDVFVQMLLKLLLLEVVQLTTDLIVNPSQTHSTKNTYLPVLLK
jgi:hypothetical protein